MQTLSAELTHEEQHGQLVWTDPHGNMRITEGIFWLAFSKRPTVAWKTQVAGRPERFCDLEAVTKFKPRA